MRKAAESIEKIKGRAAGVNADGTDPNEQAYAKVRALTQKHLRMVRKQKAYYIAEEKRLMAELEAMPLPGQRDFLVDIGLEEEE